MPLTQATNTPERLGPIQGYPVKAGVTLYQGGIAALDENGFAVPASDAANLVAIGRVEATIDNINGGDGAEWVEVKTGVFRLLNDTTTPVTQAHVGRAVKLADDATATGSGSGSAAGICLALEPGFVWVRIGI